MGGSVSITGTGIICAIGNDTGSVLASLRRGESGVGRMKYLQSAHTDIPVGEVKMSTGQMMEMLGVKSDHPVSRTSLMGAIAVREALEQAGIRNLEGRRVTLISGTTVGVMDVTETYYERMKTEPELQYLPHSNECGKSTREIAEYAGLDDVECCTISTACSSALNAIILGSEMLKRDETDLVIAGGTESLSKFHLNGFNTLMILDRERCRPFDADRAGLNLGEGAAFVVLEKNASNGLAFVRGYANRCDAFHQTASSENGDGAYLAMTAALDMAGLSPEDIQYVNAHGTGTPNNDLSESKALIRVFGDDLPEISSTKAFTGHTTSASGSIETVICVLALRNDFTPPSLGWKNPIPGSIVPTMGHSCIHLDNIICNSFGFGGNDSSLVISRSDKLAECESVADKARCRIVSRKHIGPDDNLADLREFLSPIETRRMSRLMKAGFLASLQAVRESGIGSPDAIIAATSRGMLETSILFLEDIVSNGEELLKPTLFMQSTHNTISSALAIRLGCHGYNITYSQGDQSMEWAIRDAERLIKSGDADSVLICSFDETVKDGKSDGLSVDSMIMTEEAL